MFAFNARRIHDDISTILRPASLILDASNTLTILFPKMATDLFDHLQSDHGNPIHMLRRFRIVQQMIDALENCWVRGIHHVDLRMTNILVITLSHYVTILIPNVYLFFFSPQQERLPFRCFRSQGHVKTLGLIFRRRMEE